MSLILVLIRSLYKDQSSVVNTTPNLNNTKSIFRKFYKPETSILFFLSNSCVTHCDHCVTQAVGKRLTWYQSFTFERTKNKALVRETLGVEKKRLEDFVIRFQNHSKR